MSETTKTKSASKTSKTSKKQEEVESLAPVKETKKSLKAKSTEEVKPEPVKAKAETKTSSKKSAKVEKTSVEVEEAALAKTKTKSASKKSATKKSTKSASKAKGNAKEEVEEDDPRKRYFHCVYKNKDGEVVRAGRYSGKKPKQAARKALSRVVDKNEVKLGEKITFLIKECTRGRKKKAYSYEGSRVELKEPVVVEIKKKEGGTAKLTYKHDNVVKKVPLTECADLLNVDFNDHVVEEELQEEVKVKKVEKGGSKKTAEKVEKVEKTEPVKKTSSKKTKTK